MSVSVLGAASLLCECVLQKPHHGTERELKEKVDIRGKQLSCTEIPVIFQKDLYILRETFPINLQQT